MHRAIRIAFFFALVYCILYAAINKLTAMTTFAESTFRMQGDRNSPVLDSVDDVPLGKTGQPMAELAPGVVQIPGSWYSTIVRQTDGIVIIEAPISSGYSSKVMDEANRRFPDLPIKAVITSNNFWWHFGGIREYAARGIPIYVLDQNAALIRSVLASPHTLTPDSLQRKPHKANLVPISNATVVGSGPNRVVLYPIRATSGQMMMVYFPEYRLLYTSEMVQPFGPGGAFQYPQTLWELVREVHERGIDVETMIGMHMGPTPWSKLESTLNDALEGSS